MSGEPDGSADLSRRNFVKATGAVAGAGLLGTGAAGAGGAETDFDPAFANWRVREASRVWKRGYTGRRDRTVGLTDTGIDARHPDLGPWNGVRAVVQDGELRLTGPEFQSKVRVELDHTVERRGEAGPGTFATESEVATEPFDPPADAEELDAALTWDPSDENANDLELRLDVKTGGEDGEAQWEEVATAATANEEEKLVGVQVDPSDTYRFVAEQYATVACTFEITGTFYGYDQALETTDDPGFVFDFADDEPRPKTVGWYDAGARYGDHDAPRDPDGHGSHCASIASGTGRAGVVDTDSPDYVEEVPRAILLPGESLTYAVAVPADGGVFVSAYGENVEAAVQFPEGNDVASGGIDADHSLFDNTLVDAHAVHEEGTETYTVVVRPMANPESGASAAGRVQRVAAGPLVPPGDAAGEAENDGEVSSLHAGLAPDAGLVGLQGLSDPTADLGEFATEFRDFFNMRAVNMSWGYVGGAPLGAAGGTLDDTVAALREIAHGGILPVAAAGNSATPANGNGAPNVADEAISVAATDPVDGLASYSSGGVGAVDENAEDDDDSRVYGKPDVTAPGGAADGYPAGVYDLVRAAKAGEADVPESEQDPIRGYAWKAGTSMAAPYVTGVAGLLAEAMEFDAPGEIALPEPEETEYEDVMRLKGAVLATATETAFTAAPFHHPSHRPTYEFGERDPYEGYGRVNPDAAVDAVSRELLELPDGMPVGRTVSRSDRGDASETVGLAVPDDARAVAGYVDLGRGTFEASAEFDHYAGGNEGFTKGEPHLDLFVYDAGSPGTNGEPNVVAKAQGRRGSAAVTVETAEELPDESAADSSVAEASPGVYYVVAKLVNVPGAVNTNDVRVHFDLDVSFTQAAAPPYDGAVGSRQDDATAFTAGQSDAIDVTVTDLGDAREVDLYDVIPRSWTPQDGHRDHVETIPMGDVNWVYLGSVGRAEVDGEDAEVTRTYFVEVPDETGEYTLGPAKARAVGENSDRFGADRDSDVGGTDENVVIGVSTNPDEAGGSVTDEADTVTGGVDDPTGTVSDAGGTVSDAVGDGL